jgi:hypothetical protein
MFRRDPIFPHDALSPWETQVPASPQAWVARAFCVLVALFQRDETFVRQGRNLEVPGAGMSKVRDRGDGGSGPNDPLRVPEYCLDSPSRPSLRSTNWRHKRRRRPVRWALPAST